MADLRRQLIIGLSVATFTFVVTSIIVFLLLYLRSRSHRTHQAHQERSTRPLQPNDVVNEDDHHYDNGDMEVDFRQHLAFSRNSFSMGSNGVGSGVMMGAYQPPGMLTHSGEPFLQHSGSGGGLVATSTFNSHQSSAGQPAPVPFRQSRLPTSNIHFSNEGRLSTEPGPSRKPGAPVQRAHTLDHPAARPAHLHLHHHRNDLPPTAVRHYSNSSMEEIEMDDRQQRANGPTSPTHWRPIEQRALTPPPPMSSPMRQYSHEADEEEFAWTVRPGPSGGHPHEPQTHKIVGVPSPSRTDRFIVEDNRPTFYWTRDSNVWAKKHSDVSMPGYPSQRTAVTRSPPLPETNGSSSDDSDRQHINLPSFLSAADYDMYFRTTPVTETTPYSLPDSGYYDEVFHREMGSAR